MRKLPIIETRQCVICGNSFGITAQQKNKKYCDGCRKTATREKDKEWKKRNSEKIKQRRRFFLERHRKPIKILQCQRCGADYKAWKGKSLYCIECLRNSTDSNERQRAWTRREY